VKLEKTFEQGDVNRRDDHEKVWVLSYSGHSGDVVELIFGRRRDRRK
jgi:hypothetical protein